MDVLFPNDWRDQVRALLKPFEKESSSDEERRGEWRCYSVDTIRLTESDREDSHGLFQMGGAYLSYVYHSQGEGGASDLIWGRKNEFVSPLHFWAAAATIYLSSETGFADPWLDFRISPTSRLVQADPPFRLGDYITQSHCLEKEIPRVPVLEEICIRYWELDSKWNDIKCLMETQTSFCWSCWHTGA